MHGGAFNFPCFQFLYLSVNKGVGVSEQNIVLVDSDLRFLLVVFLLRVACVRASGSL